MALSAIVAKKRVSLTQADLYAITLNLRLLDGTTEVLNKDFTQEYRTGQVVSTITAAFIGAMQAEIGRYKAEQAIYINAQLDTGVTNIQNGLVV